MREILLYDPERRPASWNDVLHPGQYAVLRSDTSTDAARATCLVFDSLAEAEKYCEAEVDQVAGLRCDVYDHAGKAKPPFASYANRAMLRARPRRALWGWGLIAASLPCFWFDWWRGRGALIIPTVIGINMLFAGLRLVYWGTAGSRKGAR